MKKNFLPFLLSLTMLSPTAHGQEKITNIRSNKHVDIPLTKFSIVPPDSAFSLNLDLSGLEGKNLKWVILMSDAVHPEMRDSLKSRLKRNGTILLEKEMEINGFRAILLKTEQMRTPDFHWSPPDNPMFWTLFAAAGNRAWTATGLYPADFDNQLAQAIERSLLSIVYAPEKQVLFSENPIFSLDTEGTLFKYAERLMQMGARFNLEGRSLLPGSNADRFEVIFPRDEVPMEARRNHTLQAAAIPYQNGVLQEIKEIELAGLKGYEAVGYDCDPDKNRVALRYVVSLFGEGRRVEMSGFAISNFEERLAQFRQLASTFRLKAQ